MTTRTNPVTPWLSPSSDTGVVGDRITALQNVQIGFSNWINSSSAFAWLDGDGNTTFNSNADTLIIGGYLNVSLDPGANFFTFYQVNKEDITSEPAYLSILYDSTAAAAQTQASEDALAKAALAYLGRPLTSAEHDSLFPLVQNTSNDTSALISQLANSLEFRAVYSEPGLSANIERCYNILFSRDPSAQEINYWGGQVAGGASVQNIPWLIAQGASGNDLTTLAARVMFAQQATSDFDANLAEAEISERTLLEVERESVQSVTALSDIGTVYESMLAVAGSIGGGSGSGSGTTSLAGPDAALNSAYDDGTVGDSTTSLASVKIDVSGITAGGIAWLDVNYNGTFDPGEDTPVINGSVSTNLDNGPNTLAFYQMLGDTVSTVNYLLLLRSDSSAPSVAPSAPSLDLVTVDDDGVNTADNVTTKNLVQIDVSGLDASSEQAWIETDGNGVFDLGGDVALDTGATTANALVQLSEGINGFSVYQTRAGLTSVAGNLTVTMIQNTDVASAAAWAIVGSTVSLEFDRPVDWGRLDTDDDGILTVSTPENGGELELEWGIGGKDFDFEFTTFTGDTPDAGTWNVEVPTYGGRFLTITNTPFTTGALTDGDKIMILVVGIPDVATGVTSDVYFSGITL